MTTEVKRWSDALPGDLVQGAVSQLTARGRRGWGINTHIAKVDHRYGPHKDLINVISLCGRRGRLESGSNYADMRCKVCVKVARKRGIKWRS
jgi:hypothetical protein